MEPTDAAAPASGSIAGVAARLFLWARRAPKGLACVEFDSDYSRQQVDARVRGSCEAAGIPFYAVELPRALPAPDVVTWIKQQLAPLPHGVVSITGWATAFAPDVPLIDSLRVLNYNRENVAQFPLCQIWWLTRPLAGTFIREIPDLHSWFIVRLSLDENIVDETAPFASLNDNDAPPEVQVAARKQAAAILTRFDNAINNGSNVADLLMLGASVMRLLYSAGLNQDASNSAVTILDRIINVIRQDAEFAALDDDAFNRPEAWDMILAKQAPIRDNNQIDIASLYQAAERTHQAEAILLAAVRASRPVQGERLTGAPAALFHLVFFYCEQGRFDDAASLLEETVSKMEATLGRNYPLLVGPLRQLAVVRWYQKSYFRSEALLQRALTIAHQEASLFPDAEIAVLAELSRFYESLGRIAEAELYKQEAHQRENEFKTLYDST